jgi:hypothetical protein
VDVGADVPFVGEVRGAGVDADPDTDRPVRQSFYGLGRGAQRSTRRRERYEERVTLCVDLDPAARRERTAQHAPVLAERIGIRLGTELVQQPRRALDVSEEERHRARGQIFAHGRMMSEQRPRCHGVAGLARFRTRP